MAPARRLPRDGVDMSAPRGTPIYAVLDGIVEVVSNNGPGFRGYGRVIVINHGGRLWSLYSHNSANYVKVGQHVKQGDKIAAVGRTGRATGNHLHPPALRAAQREGNAARPDEIPARGGAPAKTLGRNFLNNAKDGPARKTPAFSLAAQIAANRPSQRKTRKSPPSRRAVKKYII